ncbi:DUF4230 domain-containing protein [Spirulina sp. CCNP1310]|uniref:DUF4230 domain-containing protein n=1 Tax=Spirulina sp. CCNP1310 TaxID=3110249 RepID=UPI002B21DA92|nr:DUF4230 domain-containing protein [Spirulina sp. CCNP1310]MEA5418490.1 DUF4230 domain-containing protein [Spirulina sp. CCNP1310]
MRSIPQFPKLSPWLSCTAGGAIALTLGLTLTLRFGNHWAGQLLQGLGLQTPPPRVDVGSLILTQIREASELTTAIYTLETVVPTAQSRQWAGITIGTTKLLYIAHGEVKAGIDLSQLTERDIQVSEAGITIHLPAVQILDRKIDVERSQVYDYNRGFLGLGPDAAPQLQTLAQRETLQQITTAACEQGILTQAGDRAEITIIQLLTLAGHNNITVTTAPPPDCAALVSMGTTPERRAKNFSPLRPPIIQRGQ